MMLRRAMNVVVASLCRGALQVMLPRSTATQRRATVIGRRALTWFGFLLQLYPQEDISHRSTRPRRRGE